MSRGEARRDGFGMAIVWWLPRHLSTKGVQHAGCRLAWKSIYFEILDQFRVVSFVVGVVEIES